MDYLNKVMEMLKSTHSQFHAVEIAAKELSESGFAELMEGKPFPKLEPGKRYYVKRNQSSIIAFKVPLSKPRAIRVAAAHSDSPTFKIKPNPILASKNLAKVNVEPYGGALYSPWLDRALSFAGRIMVKTPKGIGSRLIDLDEDLMVIPSVCIHMKRDANESSSFNAAIDMVPIIGEHVEGLGIPSLLQDRNILKEDEELVSFDLSLYVRDEPKLVGLRKELLLAPRLDDLSSAYSGLLGFIEGEDKGDVDAFCIFDNEEVGSLTRQGANSTFLKDTLRRLCLAMGLTEDEMLSCIANGFLLSEDNAHANHPNHPELSDPTTDVRLNGGIVIKHNANQKYTTDAYSAALVKGISEKEGLPYQEYTNRSDLRGGSTLGNISNSEVSFRSADIGLAQLAMHSCNETMGAKDIECNVRFNKAYFSLPLNLEGESIEIGE